MTTLYGFELVQEQVIPELNMQAQLYRHVKTGGEVLSLQNDDENKVFGIVFATPPDDSTGLPHIMEHSVLCGSRKYPVKEPFVELIKGSLNTFVNAFTAPDKTMYPLASQNLQDFYNLVDVYLDAVFFPNLTPLTLQQEGWHYELDDPDAPLVYKGVVFNEMKGAYSDPDNLLNRYSRQSVFPDNTYGVDSGGDPTVIPNLTYEQFKRFHDTYYHPSNARVFFYGDDPPAERLRLLDAYFSEFGALPIPVEIGLQNAFAAPRHLTYSYAVGEDEDTASGSKKGMVTANWVLTDHTDEETALGLEILDHILIGTPASPLRKALIDSGLGEDLTGDGLYLGLRQPMFSVGLKGIDPDDAVQVETLILNTLRTLAIKRIDPEMIEAAVNTVEFALRENNTGSFPRGISLGWKTMRTWMYGGDPFDPLLFEAPLAAIKARLAKNERYFEDLLNAYFLDNTHRARVLLKPDPQLSQRQEAAETDKLAQVRRTMTQAEIQRVLDDTRELKHRQETPDSPEALATIPSLSLADLDKENKHIPLAVLESHGAQVLYHDLFTNGIVYLDVGLNLHAVPQALLPYVGLFGRALLEMGTATEDFVKLLQRIGRQTGGIRPSQLAMSTFTGESSTTWLLLRGKSTPDKTGELLAILRDVLLTANFDNQERFRQLVLEEKSEREALLVPRGHMVVRNRLEARFNEANWFSEQTGGTSYLFFLRELVDKIENDWPGVVENLEAIRRVLVNRHTMLCNVTLDAEHWNAFQPQINDFLAGLPAADPDLKTWSPDYATGDEGLVIPAQVNYVGKGADLYQLGYEFNGSIVGITNYLRTTWLWERVRVHGGAYGGFVVFDRRSGNLSYLSYRDPNLLNTLDTYDQTAQFLRDLDLSEAELTKVIIGAIGILDDYQLPDAKGYTSLIQYLTGDSEERRQQMRDDILGLTLADFHAFADVLAQVNEQGVVVVLGSQDDIEAAQSTRMGGLTITKVL
ncbi:MAG: insulinase family protein [Anaerolineae bacterium]|nr:insulinase family protein [Anaerolineae bacterium]